ALLPGDEAHSGEHARPQRGVGVMHDRADHDRASSRVEQRVDREDLAFVGAARQCIERNLQRLADLNLLQIDFGHAEIDLKRIDRLEVHDVGALLHVIADRHDTEADDPRERRLDLGLGELRLGELQRRFGGAQVGLGFVFRLSGNEIAFGEVDRAIELRLRKREVRARLLHIGGVDRRIELDQRRALGDALTFGELDCADAPPPSPSGATGVDYSERRLPTAVIVCGIGAAAIRMASTVTWPDGPLATALLDAAAAVLRAESSADAERFCPIQYPPPAAIATATTASQPTP